MTACACPTAAAFLLFLSSYFPSKSPRPAAPAWPVTGGKAKELSQPLPGAARLGQRPPPLRRRAGPGRGPLGPPPGAGRLVPRALDPRRGAGDLLVGSPPCRGQQGESEAAWRGDLEGKQERRKDRKWAGLRSRQRVAKALSLHSLRSANDCLRLPYSRSLPSLPLFLLSF